MLWISCPITWYESCDLQKLFPSKWRKSSLPLCSSGSHSIILSRIFSTHFLNTPFVRDKSFSSYTLVKCCRLLQPAKIRERQYTPSALSEQFDDSKVSNQPSRGLIKYLTSIKLPSPSTTRNVTKPFCNSTHTTLESWFIPSSSFHITKHWTLELIGQDVQNGAQITFAQVPVKQGISRNLYFHPSNTPCQLLSYTFVPFLPFLLFCNNWCSAKNLPRNRFQNHANRNAKSVLYQFCHRCFENFVEDFEVMNISDRRSHKNWQDSLNFLVMSPIQLLLFYSGPTV